jgi:DedD protein
MALFKSRKKKVDEPVAAASPAESIEVMRRRARHRLIGAVVLVLVGVVGFPLLFDTQPRPVAVDIPIEIPDRNKVKPLPLPAPAPAPAVTQAPPPAASAPVAAAPAPAPGVANAEEPKTESKVAAVKAEAPPPAANDGAKALAILEGKPVAAAEGRYVVQVGAFTEPAKIKETRNKLEGAGLKTYAQAVEKDGRRIVRVRVGPFASKADADKAAEKVKGLDLPASVLTL